MFFSPRALYLAADGKTIVEHGDDRAATILLGNGSPYKQHFDERFGISEYLEKHPDAPKTKALKGPPKTKEVKPEANKGKADEKDAAKEGAKNEGGE